MNPTQTVYLARLADYETALEAVKNLSPVWTGEETEKEFLEKDEIECNLYEQFHITAKRSALFQARRMLFAWAKQTISEEMSGDSRLEQALQAFDLARGNVAATEKLVSLCLKLTV